MCMHSTTLSVTHSFEKPFICICNKVYCKYPFLSHQQMFTLFMPKWRYMCRSRWRFSLWLCIRMFRQRLRDRTHFFIIIIWCALTIKWRATRASLTVRENDLSKSLNSFVPSEHSLVGWVSSCRKIPCFEKIAFSITDSKLFQSLLLLLLRVNLSN